MRIRLNEEELRHLNAYLDACPDCERLTAKEVVLDLYDNEEPVSMNFVFVNGGIGVDGCAKLVYSPEEDGYYMGDRIEDPQTVRRALEEAGALPQK